MIDVASAIRAERARRRLTQAELAAATGLHINTIRSYELDRTSPTVSDLERIARSLGVHVCSLLTTVPAEREVATAAA